MRLHARFLALAMVLSLVSVFVFLSHVQSATRVASTPRVVPVVPQVSAQPNLALDPRPPDVDLDLNLPAVRRMQLALARICVSESGFQTRTNDCTLIYHALRTRSSTGEITMGIMRAYSGRTFDRSRTDRHRWIPHLSHNFREPNGWSETVTIPWSARREGFVAVYNHVGNLLRTRPENTCGVRIDHWGARGFRRDLHLSNGWRLVECGETLNDFWTLPSTDVDDSDVDDNVQEEVHVEEIATL